MRFHRLFAVPALAGILALGACGAEEGGEEGIGVAEEGIGEGVGVAEEGFGEAEGAIEGGLGEGEGVIEGGVGEAGGAVGEGAVGTEILGNGIDDDADGLIDEEN